MKHGVSFLLLDAFRADYLGRTVFLKKLSERSGLGSLQEPFGFIPRPAYFSGLEVDAFGYSNMLCFDPKNSPFGVARFIPRVEYLNENDTREWIIKAAQNELTAFEKAYASSLSIPLEYLPYFDFSEQQAPWSQDCSYKSIFHILNTRGQAWYQHSWPYTNEQQHSDKDIIRKAVQNIKQDHVFSFIHLSELDAIGHQYGPGSKELQKKLEETDKLCESFFEHLQSTYDSFSLIIFGDHGMLPVLDTYNIEKEIAQLNLRFGQDFAYFIDSTLVRFWFFHKEAKQIVTKYLSHVTCGHFLSEEELGRHHLKKANLKNGHAYFLARPGILFYPNFFQAKGAPPKGMHGYSPEVEDNQGLLLLHQSHKGQALELGVVKAKQLFSLALHECNIPVQEHTNVPLPPLHQARENSPWTKTKNKKVTQEIQHQIETIAHRIQAISPDYEAITMAGSFGRGEGAVNIEKNKIKAINDYDLLVYGNALPHQKLQSLGPILAEEFDVDFVDIGILPSDPSGKPCSQFFYDYKYGSKVLAGNPSIIQKLPNYAPSEIPKEDAILLVFNRICGLLGHPIDCLWSDGALNNYMINQVVKILISIGDAYLISWEDYACSYETRYHRFQELAHAEGLISEEINLIVNAYKHKISPNNADQFKGPLIIKKLQKLSQKALNKVLTTLKEEPPQTIERTIHACTNHMPTQNMRPWADCKYNLEKKSLLNKQSRLGQNTDPRSSIYAANILVFYAYELTSPNKETLQQATKELSNIGIAIKELDAIQSNVKTWDKIREIASLSWNALTH